MPVTRLGLLISGVYYHSFGVYLSQNLSRFFTLPDENHPDYFGYTGCLRRHPLIAAFSAYIDGRVGYAGRRHPRLYLQFLPQLQLAGIHLAFVRFVIVTAEVQKAVEDELLDLVFER